ncbi:DUF4179 domain-containing protein [Salipaludibacillus sp. HK11]|uniref:DUF4179 domain-containing protein n=1 Tax=Salipaludibacillus sp. HK11 TaxID=3394320 RepID=UPI0039FD84CB
MNCETCRNNLLEYYDYLLHDKDRHRVHMHLDQCSTCREEYEEVTKTLKDFHRDASTIEIPSSFVENVKAQLPAEKHSTKPTQMRKYKIGIPVVLLITTFMIALFASTSFYYSVLDFTSIDYDHLDRTIAEGYGEEFHMQEEHKGILITITEVVADELATHIYYELENTKDDEIYSIQGGGQFNIENSQEIWSDDHQGWFHMGSHKILSSEQENVERGRLEFPPIEESETIMQLSINSIASLPTEEEYEKLTEMNNSMSYDMKEIQGPWHFEVPIQLMPVNEYDLHDQSVKVEGVEFTFLKLISGPTSTQLNYNFQFDRHEQSMHLDTFSPSALLIDGERFDNFSYMSQYDNTGDYFVVFDSILFEDTNKLSISFDSIRKNNDDSIVIELDETMSFPHEVEFLDSHITLEEFEQGEGQSSVVIKDEYYQGRSHETLFINGVTDNYENHNYSQSSQGIFVDRHGEEHSYYPFNGQMESLDQPLFYTTEYKIGFDSINDDKVTLKEIRIDGYIENIEINKSFPLEQVKLIDDR